MIDLYVYQGAEASFTLYEDENINYNYEKGAYATVQFDYDETAKTLKIAQRKGESPGMLKERVSNVIPVNGKDIDGVTDLPAEIDVVSLKIFRNQKMEYIKL